MDKIGLSVKKYSVLMQHYRSQYAVHYPVIAKSPFSASHAYCNVDMNIGLTDIIKHVGTVNISPKQRCIRTCGKFWSSLPENIRRIQALFEQRYCSQKCGLGCCECLCKKIKIGIVPSNHKIKLPFDIGFNKTEKFSKNVNVFDCP